MPWIPLAFNSCRVFFHIREILVKEAIFITLIHRVETSFPTPAHSPPNPPSHHPQALTNSPILPLQPTPPLFPLPVLHIVTQITSTSKTLALLLLKAPVSRPSLVLFNLTITLRFSCHVGIPLCSWTVYGCLYDTSSSSFHVVNLSIAWTALCDPSTLFSEGASSSCLRFNL